VFKPTFWFKNLMKLICNKLGNEDQFFFSKSLKKQIPYCKNLLDTYLKPKAHSEMETSKATCILKNLLTTYFYSFKYKNQSTLR
jgi:hypothetical protein